MQSFIPVFAILFNGCTGIMAGANMSGELKNPSRSIPRGTIAACSTVCLVYIILMFFIAATCSKELLLHNYTFLQPISFWPPIIFIGIILSSFSAALSCLIGASRVLYAMSLDGMFGPMLRLTKKTDSRGNPYVAVLVTWALVQIILLIGQVNTIAPIVTIFFLMAYSACDLACLGLDWASAPNFRPTFKYFSWHTALAGLISSVGVMFMVNQIWALVSIAIAVILSAVSHYTAPRVAWGSLSQALIFHQVRKYALKININDATVDTWRPGILFLCSDIMPNVESLLFLNDLKKSGLFVIGHVNIGRIDDADETQLKRKLDFWIDFVKENKIKAFVEHTMAQTLRHGSEQLLRLSGLGGMKPNTLALSMDDTYGDLSHLLSDAIKLEKNVILLKSLDLFDANLLANANSDVYIDVWPIDLMAVDFANAVDFDFDESSLFLLQLAALLSRSQRWRKHTHLRVLIPLDKPTYDIGPELGELTKKIEKRLETFRIKAEIILAHDDPSQATTEELRRPDLNRIIRCYQSTATMVSFYRLPYSSVKGDESFKMDEQRLEFINAALGETGPAVLGIGLKNVMTT